MRSSPTRKNNHSHDIKYPEKEGPEYRICSRCKKEKLSTQFYDDDRKTTMCKSCRKEDVNTRYAKRKKVSLIGDPNGEGRLDFPDGAVYIGKLKNSKRHGDGTYFFADGRQINGIWKNGILEVDK